MRVELVEFPGLKRVIEAEVSPEESLDALKKAYEELKRRMRLPGFRQGHIPRPVLERYFGKDVEANVRERLLNQGLEEAIEKYSLDLATRPKLVEDLAFTPGELCHFRLEVELKPKISLKPLEAFQIVDDSNVSVADDEVLSMLAYLQKVNAPYASLSSGDTLLPEDLARLKGAFHAEGGEAHEVELEGIVDSEFRLLLDHRHAPLQPESPWDGEGDFVYTGHLPYLPSIPEIVRGKRGTLRARLVHAQRKQLPVLDDEFAKDLGLSTLDELKRRVRDDLQREKESRVRELLKEKVANALMESHDIGLPEGVLEEAIQRHIAALERSGDNKDIDKDKVHAWVTRQLKWHYLSEALIRQAGIEVADTEVEAFLRRRFSDKGVALPSGLHDEARRALLDEKLYDYLLANVTLRRGDAA
jgi:trigger factor